jgi:hypothetical protein
MILLALALTALAEPTPADPELLRLQAQLSQFPEDYATATALARRATTLGDLQTALTAWRAAEQISGGTLELYLARALLHLDLHQPSDALQDAHRAVTLAPDAPAAWTTLAWVRRHRLVPYGLGPTTAADAYRHALRLDPAHPDATCGLGWVRAGRDDRLGALRSLRQATQLGALGCASPLLDRLDPLPWRVWSGLYLTGSFFQNDARLRQGVLGLAQVGARFADLVHLELTGRVGWIGVEPDVLGATPSQQQEVWTRVGLAHAGHGAELLVGYVHAGELDATAIGGRVWGTWWATLLGGFAWSRHTEARVLQANLDLRLPFTRQLTAQLGVQLTDLRLSNPDRDIEEEGLHPTGSLFLSWTDERFSLTAGGRAGVETRPVRFDDPSMWNFRPRILGSGLIRGGLRVHQALTLHLGYEALVLNPPARPDGTDPAVLDHLLTLGLTVSAHRPSED